jgi:hypothetical protein
MTRTTTAALLFVTMSAPAAAETCHFAKMPQADLVSIKWKSTGDPFYKTKGAGAEVFSQGSVGTDMRGMVYGADLSDGTKLLYVIDGRKAVVAVMRLGAKMIRYKGTCRR